MNEIKAIWAKWRALSANLHRWIMIPTVCYLELLFHHWVGAEFTPALFLNLLGFGLCLGGILNLISAALPGRASRWFVGIAIFLCTTVMMVELLIGDAYYNFMRPALVLVSAGGVLSDYRDIMFDMIINNLGRIVIALLPLWLLLLSGRSESFLRKRCLAASLAVSLVGAGVGFSALNVSADGLDRVVAEYDFNNSMKRNGITVSMFIELSGLANQANGLILPEAGFSLEAVTEPAVVPENVEEEETAPAKIVTAPTAPASLPTEEPTTPVSLLTKASADQASVPTEEPTAKASAPTEEPTAKASAPTEKAAAKAPASTEESAIAAPSAPEQDSTEAAPTEPAAKPEETAPEEPEPRVYQPHVIQGLDFGTMAGSTKDPTLKNLLTYMDSLTPEMENEYTGMFKGKNLILIAAESFNYALIDPELTPTLYRLSTQGIHFTNAYVPLWTGNTSGGEMAIFSGLAMNCEMNTYSSQKPFNTIGRQLMNQGYFSRAYHDNGYYFYDRDKTHENLGYEKYIGIGNGLEEGVQEVWPASDMEMFDFTLAQYIDKQPFSIYYMTCSAHCRYNFSGNAQSKKNQDLVKDLPYSTPLKAYIAANLELEKGLASLVAQLEEAGIADDTLIVMTSDHYPYGLGTAWGNDHNCLAELYGVKNFDEIQRDKNTLIMWSGCLEGKGIQIDAPVCSLDILPTLSNLFGVEYDSRMTIGRDVFGTQEAIVPWPNYSWVTELGKYDASSKKFTPFVDESLIPEGYVDRISSIVRTRISFSRGVQTCKFYTAIEDAISK